MESRVEEVVAQLLRLTVAEQVEVLGRLRGMMRQQVGGMSRSADGDPIHSQTTAGLPAATVPAAVRNLEEITYRIIGCAMQVHRIHGPGLRENSYQRDLETHFTHGGLLFTAQKVLQVYDSLQGGKLIGYYIPDFIVAGSVVVEIKSVTLLDDSHLAQVIGYLAVSGYPVGLLLNFGAHSLQWRRILPPKAVTRHQANRRWLVVPDWLKPSSPPSEPPRP